MHAGVWFRLLRCLLDEVGLSLSGRTSHGRATLEQVWQAAEREERAGLTTWRPYEHLVVESSGPVLDQQRVADLAQPFRRLGADRTGTGRGSGLGLSIVAAITEAHHGTLDLRARPDGGLRVNITLPRPGDRATKSPNTGTDAAR